MHNTGYAWRGSAAHASLYTVENHLCSADSASAARSVSWNILATIILRACLQTSTIMASVCLSVKYLLVPSVPPAQLLRFCPGGGRRALQWCALPTRRCPAYCHKQCSSVSASLATAVLETLPWAAPPAPSVRPVQSRQLQHRVVQQIPAHLVAVAEPLLLLDRQSATACVCAPG